MRNIPPTQDRERDTIDGRSVSPSTKVNEMKWKERKTTFTRIVYLVIIVMGIKLLLQSLSLNLTELRRRSKQPSPLIAVERNKFSCNFLHIPHNFRHEKLLITFKIIYFSLLSISFFFVIFKHRFSS